MVVSIPWLLTWHTWKEHVSLLLPLGRMVWLACCLPIVALVDERNPVFSTRSLSWTLALLAFVFVSLLAIRMRSDFPMTLIPATVGGNSVAGWAYAIGLPWVRTRAALSGEPRSLVDHTIVMESPRHLPLEVPAVRNQTPPM
jgi:hypothetical protein